MPDIIDPETIYVDNLPGVWAPVQWELSAEEKAVELESQATASLLWMVDAPEAVLRLLLGETGIERCYNPPLGYDPEEQGDWDPDLLAFAFKRRVSLDSEQRQPERLEIIYRVEDLGYWRFEITPEKVTIERL